MWSDPEDIDTWAISPRGAGWLFGSKVTAEFNQINGGLSLYHIQLQQQAGKQRGIYGGLPQQ
jgi:diadenosine tetraphosphatase ApaH/serine/threonine PP2A family protein phosphatase